jgi:hypothetical protein
MLLMRYGYNPRKPPVTANSIRNTMHSFNLPHLSDMVLRTLVARPDTAALAAAGAPNWDWPPAAGDLVLVSTVRLPVGAVAGSHYETMVFPVTTVGGVDLDFTANELECWRYATAGDAFLGHSDTVARWARVPLYTTADALNQIV